MKTYIIAAYVAVGTSYSSLMHRLHMALEMYEAPWTYIVAAIFWPLFAFTEVVATLLGSTGGTP